MAYSHALPDWATVANNGNVTVFPFTDNDMNTRFYDEARLHMLRRQRAADEAMAGRNFRDALDWIRYTEGIKGENSPAKEMVHIRGSGGQLRKVWYTQTMEYHMTGGDDLGRYAAGSWGCHEVVRNSPCSPVYESDVQRARSMRSIFARMKLERDRSTSLNSSISNSHQLSLSSNQDLESEGLAPPTTPSVSPDSLTVEANTDSNRSVTTIRNGRTESSSAAVPANPHGPVPNTANPVNWRAVLGPSSTRPRMFS